MQKTLCLLSIYQRSTQSMESIMQNYWGTYEKVSRQTPSWTGKVELVSSRQCVRTQGLSFNGFCGCEVIDQHLYSPDLLPSEYHLFHNMKKETLGLERRSQWWWRHICCWWRFNHQDKKPFQQWDPSTATQKCMELKGVYDENKQKPFGHILSVSCSFYFISWPVFRRPHYLIM